MTGLRTDLYEIRLAVSYLRRRMTASATLSLFVRALPATGPSWSPPAWPTA